uniref:Uncharacterized protein n=1 Tax=Amorphochlora amoebiformis TaxID=1561963 RepID=A0A7S0GUE8_9EUKA|mmetsp:Transcript_17776/g.28343  ORF Transcript_17776/g.28343 Transcript_17776/m.28343 type:complete len:133 (+) Transcript_17776:33-431(+)
MALSPKKWFYLHISTLIQYASILADVMVIYRVHWPKDFNPPDDEDAIEEFVNKYGLAVLTILWMFVPGVFQCYVDAYTYYPVEDAGVPIEKKAYPTLGDDFGGFRYFSRWVLALLNILRLRALYEWCIGVQY